MHLAVSLWSAFVTLFVTIGPIDGAAMFSGLTADVTHAERKRMAFRAVVIAGIVLLVFAFAGNALLDILNVTLPAFQVAGGILLFLQALSLTFASPGLSSLNEGEQREAQGRGDIAVFPMAFPLIAGPGTMSAIVLLMGRAQDWQESAGICAVLLLCLLIMFVAMRVSDGLMRFLGRTGSDVVGRLSGVLLAALAVQFVFDGLRQAGVIAPV